MRPPSSPKATSAPKGWLNKLMMVLLHTPGLQGIIGGSVALVTFESRKTGGTYTTPVSYSRQGASVKHRCDPYQSKADATARRPRRE